METVTFKSTDVRLLQNNILTCVKRSLDISHLLLQLGNRSIILQIITCKKPKKVIVQLRSRISFKLFDKQYNEFSNV